MVGPIGGDHQLWGIVQAGEGSRFAAVRATRSGQAGMSGSKPRMEGRLAGDRGRRHQGGPGLCDVLMPQMSGRNSATAWLRRTCQSRSCTCLHFLARKLSSGDCWLGTPRSSGSHSAPMILPPRFAGFSKHQPRLSTPAAADLIVAGAAGSSPFCQSSIWAPSSTTRLGGSPKNEVAARAFRFMTANNFSRHSDIPGFFEGISVSRLRK